MRGRIGVGGGGIAGSRHSSFPENSRFSQSPALAGFAIPRREKRHRFLGFECSTVRARISPCHTLSAFRPLSRVLPKRASRRPALRDLIFLTHVSFYFAAEKSRSYPPRCLDDSRVVSRHRCFVINTSRGIDRRERRQDEDTLVLLDSLAKQIGLCRYF